MKTFGIIVLGLSLLLISSGLKSQSIEDHGEFVRFNYSNGDTTDIIKSHVVGIRERLDEVFLLGGQNEKASTGRGGALMVIEPADFDYSNTYDLRRYLTSLFSGRYYETYTYTSNMVDTVKYWYISATDTTLQYKVNYTNTTDTLRAKTIISE